MSFSTMNDFEIVKQIGKGSFGVVYKVKRKKDGEIYAMKCINISQMDRKSIENTLNEVRILCSINHPNIVEYKEAFLNKNDSELCIVMEYVGGGDVASKIIECAKRKVRINEPTIWKYFIQTLAGIKALNEMKIIHRDIKSANLFLSSDFETIKLGDMNVAKIAKNDLAKTQIGTPYYLAPEIWKNETYGYKCDIFSTGCVLYEMTCLRVPFQGNSMQELFKKVSCGIIARIPEEYSNDLYVIIKLCLTINPKIRPTVDELLDHPIVRMHSSELNLDFKLDSDKLDKLMGTIKIDKKSNKMKIDLPNQKKYRAKSVSIIDKEIDLLQKKNSQKEEINKKSVAELMEIIRGEKIKAKPKEGVRENSQEKSKRTIEVERKGLDDKCIEKLKAIPKPTSKLPPIKQSGKPMVAVSSKQISTSIESGPDKIILENRKNDVENKKTRQNSPQIKKYNDYLEMLIEQNKEYLSKQTKPVATPRSGSADPRKKAQRYSEYNENKPFWWG